MAEQIITQEYLQSIFDYKDGELYWKIAKQNVKKYCIAGLINSKTYKSITINKKHYYNHRLIFLYHYGYLPKILDHVDGNKFNNKIENLRPSSLSENQYNKKIPKHNTSGFKGIFFRKKTNKWQVKLIINKKQTYFGSYHDIEVAKFVVDTMRYKYHKEFARIS